MRAMQPRGFCRPPGPTRAGEPSCPASAEPALISKGPRMAIMDRHFLKYAGALPAKTMFSLQRLASIAFHKGDVYEKPLDSPDRPSNITKGIRDGTGANPADLPDNILAANSKFVPPVPEGQELTAPSKNPDSPSNILANLHSSPLSSPAGQPQDTGPQESALGAIVNHTA